MKRIHNKDEIIKIGMDAILNGGFNATGIETILKRSQVPKGSFYNFFASKEEFGLEIIDRFAAEMVSNIQPVLSDETRPPLERLRTCFEALAKRFEESDCTQGCLIGNLGLEMSGQSEQIRLRLEEVLQRWAGICAGLLREAQQHKALAADLEPEMIAESLVSSFQGALLRAKVKRSAGPLWNFIHLYFDKFLL